MSSPTTPARRRSPAFVVVDIVVSVVIVVFALVFGLVLLDAARQFAGFGSACGPGPYSGLECNPAALAIAAYGLLTVTVLAFFLGLGLAIVRVIQKRLVFVWPLGALVVMILAFTLSAYVAGLTVPA